MKRRRFLALMIGTGVAWPMVVEAAQVGSVWRIGQVLSGTRDTVGNLGRALEQSLAKLGYVPGQNVVLTTRFAAPQAKAIEETIAASVPVSDILVTWSTLVAVSAKKVAPALP